ncbi:hypothetical protein NKR23_g5512 [Pleurostoma richardsiae]|uniref:Uncharacterized protein n=1 Tax=Pleurostoma richardsiae TaxID=41990 RepID=A0AA38VQE2_9PEZI|nr:hypothetical protein NKR23_g5512 [Pleurostoma richardsiae]
MAVATPSPLPDPSTGADLVQPHHNRDFALHKYLLLHEQHESLREHIEQLRPFNSPSTIFSQPPDASSPAIAPTRAGFDPVQTTSCHTRPLRSAGRNHTRSASLPTLPTLQGGMGVIGSTSCAVPGRVVDEVTMQEVAQEEARLCDVNESIKRALTELLNCEAVRADTAFRTWVQCRLMDTERELRHGRRRRSSPAD